MTKVLFTGSFDPVTIGHYMLVKKCAQIFDSIYVTAFINPDKTDYMFTPEKRKAMLERAFSDIPNVKTDFYSGMVVDYARKNGINVIVRGIRDEIDARYEIDMAQRNRAYAPEITTVFMAPEPGYENVSSSLIKRIIRSGGDVSTMLPPGVFDMIK